MRLSAWMFALSLPLTACWGEVSETGWLGDYVAALSAQSRLQRVNAMLDCASSSLPRARDAKRWLLYDLPRCEPNTALCRRLILFWQEHPAESDVGFTVYRYLKRSKTPAEELLPLLRTAVESFRWPEMDADQLHAALLLWEEEFRLLILQGKYALADEIFQKTLQQGIPKEEGRCQAVQLYSNICRHEELLPPFRRDPVPEWREKRDKAIRKLLTSEDTLSEDECIDRFVFYFTKYPTRLHEFAKKIRRRFPDSKKFQQALVLAALVCQDVKLLPPAMSGKSAAMLLCAGKYDELSAFIEKYPPERKAFWETKMKAKQKKWSEAEACAARLPDEMLAEQEVFTMLIRIYDCTGSRRLWERLKQEGIRRSRAESAQDYAVTANALGYTTALRNIDLPVAETFLTAALATDPENPSFLDSMGYLRYRQKRYAEAKNLIVSALRNCTFDTPPEEILFHAAQIEWELSKDKALCRTLLESALRFAAENPETQLPMDDVKLFQQEIR